MKDFSLMRYPGSKLKHMPFLKQYIPTSSHAYADVMVGSGAFSISALSSHKVSALYLNDIDFGIYSLWYMVKNFPDTLVHRIQEYTPNSEDFYAYKEETPTDIEKAAFQKLVLHQISYSGLGEAAGSPIGGRKQQGKYKVGCRWNADIISKKIHRAHYLLTSTRTYIYNLDALALVSSIPEDILVYADPPYVEQGKSLYKYGDFPHASFASLIQERGNFLISYDDCPLVRSLYSKSNIVPVQVTSHLKHSKIQDVLITPSVPPH